MPRQPARSLILSQDQVTEFTANLRKCVDAWQGGAKEVTAGSTIRSRGKEGYRLRNLTPAKALLNMADYLEALYRQQNGARRLTEAWDYEQAKIDPKTGRKTP